MFWERTECTIAACDTDGMCCRVALSVEGRGLVKATVISLTGDSLGGASLLPKLMDLGQLPRPIATDFCYLKITGAFKSYL